MPKELFEIKAFESGNIYNADDRDIPDDAAVYSENIDPYAQSGSLMAIQADATAIKSGVDAKRMAMINNNGTHQLAYIDNSDGHLKQIADVYTGSPAISTLIASNLGSGSIPAMQTNNKEVHVGLGQTQNVKWVGNIPHGQFGGSVPSGLQAEDAELAAPSPFPLMHKIVTDASNTYVYGISENGNYVYKLEVSTGKLIKRSKHYFTATRAMCISSDGNLWVVDKISSTLHLIKIDTEEMDIFIDTVFTGIATDMTDISEQGSYIWFAKGKSDNTSQTASWLYNKLKSSFVNSAGTQTLTNKTPYRGVDHNGGTTVANGTFIWDGDNDVDDDDQISIQYVVPSICLFTVNGQTDWVGVLAKVTILTDQFSPVPDTGRPRFYKDASSKPAIGNFSESLVNNKGWVYLAIKSDYTTNAVLDGTYARLYPISSDVDTSVELAVFAHSVNQTAQSTYMAIAFQHTTSAYTKLFVSSKISLSTNGTRYGSEQSSYSQASLHMDNAIISAVGNKWNIFSKLDTPQWALKSGTSNATAFKQSQVNFNNFANNSLTSASGNAYPQFYATSFTYDGYQETPLSPWEIFNGTDKQITFTLRVYAAGLNKRITHINIYRSNGATETQTVSNAFFRLVDSISVKYGWSETNQPHTSPSWGKYYEKDIIDNRDSYASYESRTGISEALLTTLPKYGLSAKVNNFLYITDCSHIDIDDATNYLFKSRPFNFDQFNWAKDFLLLPNKATAMESFNGRLYVFSENETYVVNPDGMYIEDTIKGIGCRNQNGVFSSEIGMCFIDKNSIYLHNGQGINDIGAKIKKAHQVDDTYNSYSTLEKLCNYSANDYTGDIVIAYDSYRKAFCFMYTYKYTISSSFTHSCNLNNNDTTVTSDVANSNIAPNQVVTGNHIPADTKVDSVDNDQRFDITNNATATAVSTLTFTTNTTYYVPQCLVYTVPKNRWDVWNRTNSSTTTDFNTYGAVHGKNNELFVSDTDNGLIQPFAPTNTTRLDNFTWYSKKFTMGDSTADKKIYKAEILSEDNSPTITLNTVENSSSYTALSDKKIARHAQVKIVVTGDTTATVDALRLVFRRLRRTKDMS